MGICRKLIGAAPKDLPPDGPPPAADSAEGVCCSRLGDDELAANDGLVPFQGRSRSFPASMRGKNRPVFAM